jgi:phage tail-like protein
METLTVRAWRSIVLAVIVISVIGTAEAGAQGVRRDALHAFSFRVEIEGVDLGTFRSVSGLTIENEVIEFREGGSDVTHKLIGPLKWKNIVLKQGFGGSTRLYDWYRSFTPQSPMRVNGSIVMLDAAGLELARWQFVRGFPVKWEGPDFDASGNDIPIETIEIAHEGLTMTTPGRP